MRHSLKLLLATTMLASFSADAQIRPPLGGSGVGNAPAAPAPGGSASLLSQAPAPSAARPNFVSQNERDLAAQASGNYPTMKRSSTLPIGAIQKKWSSPKARPGQTAPGIMRYVWRPDFVMRVITREFMTTTVELPAWETVERIILGDTMVFEASRVKKNVLVIRPTHAGADSNMTVIGTSGNIYNFYMVSEGWNSKQLSDLTVYVRASDPTKAENAGGMGSLGKSGDGSMSSFLNAANQTKAVDGKKEYLRTIDFDPSNLQFDMKMYAQNPKDIELAPERVYHDGLWTYFDYGTKADSVKRPVIHQVVDGVDTVVNTRTIGDTGNIIVAESVGDFTLRNGRKVICVYRGTAPKAFPFKVVKNKPEPYLRRDDNREPTFWDRVFGRKGAPTSKEKAETGITRGGLGGQYEFSSTVPTLDASDADSYVNPLKDPIRVSDLDASNTNNNFAATVRAPEYSSKTVIAPQVEPIDSLSNMNPAGLPTVTVPQAQVIPVEPDTEAVIIKPVKDAAIPRANTEWAPDNFVSVIR